MDEQTFLSPEETRTLKDLLNLAGALAGSLSSEQVAGFARTSAEALPLLELLADPGVQRLAQTLREDAQDLADALAVLARYQRSGQLEGALDLLTLLGSLREALDAGTIARVARTATELACAGDRVIAETGGLRGLVRCATAAQEAAADAQASRERIGPLKLWRAMREPGTQAILRFLVSFANRVRGG